MSQRWRVIDLSESSAEVSTRPGRIVVDGVEVPLSDVACILTGARTRWTGALVAKAAKYEVAILNCDWRGVPISYTLPWSANSRIATRHLAQCDLSLPRRKNAWMQVVRSKIRGQSSNLGEPHRTRIAEVVASVRSGDPDNIEARAARMYWPRLFPDETFSRDSAEGERNAHLNYGYAILRGHVIRAICVAGLLPGLGIFHRSRANAFGLADDLIEPFRPAVDFVVAQLPSSALLEDAVVKRHLASVAVLPMAHGLPSVAASINDLCQRFAIYVEGATDRLQVPTWVRPSG